jgi:hypothetical protein
MVKTAVPLLAPFPIPVAAPSPVTKVLASNLIRAAAMVAFQVAFPMPVAAVLLLLLLLLLPLWNFTDRSSY